MAERLKWKETNLRILISSHGTRGDVQPYLALAVGLQQAGHQVTLTTSYNYTEWIQAYGVNAHPTRFSLQAFMQQPETLAVMKSGNLVQQFRILRRVMSLGAQAMDDVWAAIQSADFVIQSPTSSGALEAAQKRGLPAALGYPVPFAPTRAFPSFFLGPARFSLGPGYNHLTHSLMHRLLWSGMSGPLTNTLRKKLGLPAWRSFAEQGAAPARPDPDRVHDLRAGRLGAPRSLRAPLRADGGGEDHDRGLIRIPVRPRGATSRGAAAAGRAPFA